MASIVDIAKHIAVSHDDKTVVIELICTDAYAASILYDDVLSRLQKEGLVLRIRCGGVVEPQTGGAT